MRARQPCALTLHLHPLATPHASSRSGRAFQASSHFLSPSHCVHYRLLWSCYCSLLNSAPRLVVQHQSRSALERGRRRRVAGWKAVAHSRQQKFGQPVSHLSGSVGAESCMTQTRFLLRSGSRATARHRRALPSVDVVCRRLEDRLLQTLFVTICLMKRKRDQDSQNPSLLARIVWIAAGDLAACRVCNASGRLRGAHDIIYVKSRHGEILRGGHEYASQL